MNLILFDDHTIWQNLLPLTYTRPVSECRIGILTIREKWEKNLGNPTTSWLAEKHLSEKFPLTIGTDNFYINSALCPDETLIKAITELKAETYLCASNTILAAHLSNTARLKSYTELSTTEITPHTPPYTFIQQPWDLLANNGAELRKDFLLITKHRQSQPIDDPHTITYNLENIFLEEGVKIRASVLNAENGPIYIGKNAEIREGCLIKGPFSMDEGALLNMGSKMRGDNTIGPFCKVGGEVSNSIFFERSNKLHDGFVGSSVIGAWCNMGAGTTTSNMKNNFGEVKPWSYSKGDCINSSRQFLGTIMGDYSKAGINSMFNTGTVIGVNCNIFGGGFPPKFIPSFYWGGNEGFTEFRSENAFEVIERNYRAIGKELTAADKKILQHISDTDKKYRNF